jgi:hypothetical protein
VKNKKIVAYGGNINEPYWNTNFSFVSRKQRAAFLLPILHWTSQLSGYHSCLIFAWSSVEILHLRTPIPSEDFCGFPQSILENLMIVPHIMPWLLPSTSFPIHSYIIQYWPFVHARHVKAYVLYVMVGWQELVKVLDCSAELLTQHTLMLLLLTFLNQIQNDDWRAITM